MDSVLPPAGSGLEPYDGGTSARPGSTAELSAATTISAGEGSTSTSRTSQAAANGTAGTLVTATPTIAGTAKVGLTLTAHPGTWTSGTAFTYQWSVAGAAVSGATNLTFVPTSAHRGKTVTVTVTGTKAGYTTAATTSRATVPVAAANTLTAAKATVAASPRTLTAATPTISGTARVGLTLTAHPGTWTSGTAFTYQWSVAGSAVPGATEVTFVPTTAHQGKTVTVKVTGTKQGYATASRTSAGVTVAASASTTNGTPVISGVFEYGARLTATPGTWVPAASFEYLWLRDGQPIPHWSGSTYFVQAADIGRRISVQVTGSREGIDPVSTLSASATATCGPAPAGGTRVTVVHADVLDDTAWTSATTDVVRVCPAADQSAPTIAATATVTVGPGVRVELIGTTLSVAGHLSMVGTSAAPIEVMSRGSLGIALDKPVDASLEMRHVHSAAALAVKCGTAVVVDSEMPSVRMNGYMQDAQAENACVQVQRSVTVERTVLTDTGQYGALTSDDWTGDVVARDNVVHGFTNLSFNVAPDPHEVAACRQATIDGNTFDEFVIISDGCSDRADLPAAPLRMRDNTMTAPGESVILSSVVLDDDSLTGNVTAEGTSVVYDKVVSATSLTLPLPNDGAAPTSAFSLRSLVVRAGATARVAAGTTLRVGWDLVVNGHLDVAAGSVITSDDPSDPQKRWGMDVNRTGSVTMAGVSLEHLTGIWTSGSLELDDVAITDATGRSGDRFDPLPPGGGKGVIVQTDGQVAVDGTYTDIPILLRQWKGSAIVRGDFVNPRPGVRLIMSCEWETAHCYVDARDIDWGSPDGPFPGMPADGVFAQWPQQYMCGSGIVWPWVGAAVNVSNQWIGGCDGVSPTPSVRLGEAQDGFRDGVSGYEQSCSTDPELYADACATVQAAFTCLAAARDLALQSSTFPINPGAEDLARDVADGALAAQEAIDIPALRDAATVAGVGLQAWDIYSTIRSVADAYSACAPAG
ncbi:hypothetical protein [Cellulomonas sp. S1-8]|uniref:hypothetical protein n=1 Tax=Cellulomonas sp. S1-8 TaxID=2904790 RepID=UPI0022430868|nr:hypothetical protein [Cellulomonas sp. S1-8]UZN02008.1 hypothetical protein OKX07_13030 [Cellulomonas sp. S1-8]